MQLVESYWEKFNRRLREEGLTQQFKVVDGQAFYPMPRGAEQWDTFFKIFQELSTSSS